MAHWHDDPASSNVARSERPRNHVLADKVRDFLKGFPVGTPVWYWKSLPDGPKVAATIRTAPFAEGDEVRCFLQGVRGVVSCDFITRREVAPAAAPAPTAAVAGGGYLVGTFPRDAAVTRAQFEGAADRPVILAGGGAEQSLFGIRVHPGENATELRNSLRKKPPGGKFTFQETISRGQ